jgi:hypothetical protein
MSRARTSATTTSSSAMGQVRELVHDGRSITGSRMARSRTICHEALPFPMIIEARSSIVGTEPARSTAPTARRLFRCSDGSSTGATPAEVDDAGDASARGSLPELQGGAALGFRVVMGVVSHGVDKKKQRVHSPERVLDVASLVDIALDPLDVRGGRCAREVSGGGTNLVVRFEESGKRAPCRRNPSPPITSTLFGPLSVVLRAMVVNAKLACNFISRGGSARVAATVRSGNTKSPQLVRHASAEPTAGHPRENGVEARAQRRRASRAGERRPEGR